jgi:hypothetical protein
MIVSGPVVRTSGQLLECYFPESPGAPFPCITLTVTILCAGQARRSSRWIAKASAQKFHQKQNASLQESPPGEPDR